MCDAEEVLLSLGREGVLDSLSVGEVKRRVMARLHPSSLEDEAPTFLSRFKRFMASRSKPRTREIYASTLSRLEAFCPGLASLAFEDIDRDWLVRFDRWLVPFAPSRNARNIHLRNIRAVFNDAIGDEVTAAYPFRRFKIKPQPTPKRSLSVEELRAFFAHPVEPHQRQYLDMFKLVFFLMGINVVDLVHLKSIVAGRVEYYRAKTARFYSVKVEPEALEIIERYRGSGWLLDVLDRYVDYRAYAMRLNRNLQEIGSSSYEVRVVAGKRRRVKVYHGLHPKLTTYWARHSWATIAASLDVPKETIAAALGHGGGSVTDIYIDFDQRKVDEANRRVLDWVLYNKR